MALFLLCDSTDSERTCSRTEPGEVEWIIRSGTNTEKVYFRECLVRSFYCVTARQRADYVRKLSAWRSRSNK